MLTVKEPHSQDSNWSGKMRCMDQAQYDGLLSNLRTGKSGLSGPESKNYVVEGEKLYYRDSDKNGKNDLLVRS